MQWKQYAAKLLLLPVLALGGCGLNFGRYGPREAVDASSHSYGNRSNDEKEARGRGGLHTGFQVYGQGEVVVADVQTRRINMPVHPDDAGFLRGTTPVNCGGNNKGGIGGAIGGEGLLGGNTVAANFGLEGSVMYFMSNKQQASDGRPERQGSFVYDDATGWAVTPTAGVTVFPHDSWKLDFSYGPSFQHWTRETGHDRWGREQKVYSDSNGAIGHKFRLSAIWRPRGNEEVWGIGVKLGETYTPLKKDELGAKSSTSAGIFIRFSF
jgi:hypothetical protein